MTLTMPTTATRSASSRRGRLRSPQLPSPRSCNSSSKPPSSSCLKRFGAQHLSSGQKEFSGSEGAYNLILWPVLHNTSGEKWSCSLHLPEPDTEGQTARYWRQSAFPEDCLSSSVPFFIDISEWPFDRWGIWSLLDTWFIQSRTLTVTCSQCYYVWKISCLAKLSKGLWPLLVLSCPFCLVCLRTTVPLLDSDVWMKTGMTNTFCPYVDLVCPFTVLYFQMWWKRQLLSLQSEVQVQIKF